MKHWKIRSWVSAIVPSRSSSSARIFGDAPIGSARARSAHRVRLRRALQCDARGDEDELRASILRPVLRTEIDLLEAAARRRSVLKPEPGQSERLRRLTVDHGWQECGQTP